MGVSGSRRFGWRTATFVVLVAAGFSASCSGGSESTTGPVVSEPGPPFVSVRPAVIRSFKILWPSDAAWGFGSIWISTRSGLTRLDPGTGRVLGTVKIPNTGEWTNVAVGGGVVWYLSGGMVARVDPASGRVLARRRFGRDDGTQAFDWLGVNAQGFCTTQRTAKPGHAVLCFDAALRNGFVAPAGPGPITTTAAGAIWVGGSSLTNITIRTRTSRSLPIPRGSRVSALAPDGVGLWAALEFHRGKAAQIWHIVAGHVVSRTPINATWVRYIARADGALVVVPYRPGEKRPSVETVARNGTLTPVAYLAVDNLNMVGTANALWVASFRHRTVTKISQFVR
jgi:hypothetical protein